MPQVLDWQNADDLRTLLDQAVQTLARGGTVAFPTETVYTLAVSTAVPEAIERLWQSTGRAPANPLRLAVSSEAEALEWVPNMSAIGRRMVRRCWPGPVTLMFGDVEAGPVSRLPENVRRAVCPSGTLGLRSPAHDAIHFARQLLGEPLALSGAYRSGEAPAVSAEQVVQSMGDAVDVVLDDGPCHYGQPSTIVRVNGENWKVVRSGVVSEASLRQQAAILILFVCTGNTCRSPLAEGLCKKLLAERLSCPPAELPERGFLVHSAGLAAMMGGEATLEAEQVAGELGADLKSHRSRPLSADLVRQADCIVAMTQSHLSALTTYFPQFADRCRLLDVEGGDISDPIGSEHEVYRQCARAIERHVEMLIPLWMKEG